MTHNLCFTTNKIMEKSFIDEISEACAKFTEKHPYASVGERETYRQGYIDGCFATMKQEQAEIKIEPSPRIDWCGDCQMEHGFECPPKERDALFDKAVKVVKSYYKSGETVSALGLKIAFEEAEGISVSYDCSFALIEQLTEAGIISAKEAGRPQKVV